MNQRQKNQVDMFAAVSGYMDANKSVWQGVPAAVAAVGELNDGIKAINDLTGAQGADATGITDDKEAIRTEYEDKIFDLADQLGALAAEKENPILAAQVDVTRTGLDKLDNGELLTIGQTVARLTGENLAALADYMVTQDDRSELTALETQFDGVKGAPRVAIAGHKGQTASLPALLTSTMRLLNARLDRLMTRFRKDHGQFVAGYQSARVIVDRGSAAKKTTTTTPPAS